MLKSRRALYYRSLTLKSLYIKRKQTYNYFASSIMKNIYAPLLLFRFPVKLICCIDFGAA